MACDEVCHVIENLRMKILDLIVFSKLNLRNITKYDIQPQCMVNKKWGNDGAGI